MSRTEEFAEKYKKKDTGRVLHWEKLLMMWRRFSLIKRALVSEERRLSYSQLKNETDRLAVSFKFRFKTADRVIVQLPNIESLSVVTMPC